MKYTQLEIAMNRTQLLIYLKNILEDRRLIPLALVILALFIATYKDTPGGDPIEDPASAF